MSKRISQLSAVGSLLRMRLMPLCVCWVVVLIWPAAPQTLSPGPATVVQPPAEIALTAIAEVWIDVNVDGRGAFRGTLRPGQRQVWRGKRSVVLVTGNAGGLRVVANGRLLPSLGRRGEVVRRRFLSPPPVRKAPPSPAKAPTPPPAPQPIHVAPPTAVTTPAVSAPTRAPSAPGRGGLSQYIQVAALGLLLVMSAWILLILTRVRRLMQAANEAVRLSSEGVKVLWRQKLDRRRTISLLEIGGRRFLVGSGGVELLGEIGRRSEEAGPQRSKPAPD